MVEFISVVWPQEHLEENLTFIAESLGPNRTSNHVTLSAATSPPVLQASPPDVQEATDLLALFQRQARGLPGLVYLHRYHEGTLSRMRTEYVIPLQGKMSARIDQLADDIVAATFDIARKRLKKERETLRKQQPELLAFDEKLRHYADKRISLDLDDGVKVNYGKFGDLLADVKAVTGGREEP